MMTEVATVTRRNVTTERKLTMIVTNVIIMLEMLMLVKVTVTSIEKRQRNGNGNAVAAAATMILMTTMAKMLTRIEEHHC